MDQHWKEITGLDLKSVRNKFAAKKSWWWHLGHSPERVESEYRQLLFLLVSHPEKTVVPWSPDVDEFWKQHILDTKKYATDCDAIAGRLIQHNPHWVEGSGVHARAYAETRKLYLASFGQAERKRRRAAGQVDWGSDMQVFSDNSGASHHHGHHCHSGWGHHGGHHDAGQLGSSDHGGGGHGGHGCGGHSSCGGHSGCGGHGH